MTSIFTYRLRSFICLIFFSSFLTAQISNQARPLIQQVVSENPSMEAVQEGEVVLRSRAVLLNEIFSTTEIRLNLFDDIDISATQVAMDQHDNGQSVWRGKINEQQFGYVLISKSADKIWGKVELDNGNLYLITPQQNNDVYILRQLENFVDTDLDCQGDVVPENRNDNNANGNTANLSTNVCDENAACTGNIVNILIVYTQAAKTGLGGTHESANAAIAMAVSEINTICSNSGVMQTFNLVHTEEVSYTEGNASTDLGRLRNAHDGFVDNVHDLRDKYYADLVCMVVSNGCGIGYVNTDPANYNATAAFSLASTGCMTGNKTLAHEAGHNMGLRHDRFVDNSSGTCHWAFGYVNQNAQNSVAQRWRTVMAYNNQCSSWGFNCSRLAYWSNPDNTHTGDPMGVPNSQSDAANSTYMLNRAICHIATFREAPNCTDCTVFQACNNYNENTSNGPGNPTTLNIMDNFTPINAGLTVEVCIKTFGDHNASSEVFNILDENGNNRGMTSSAPSGNDCQRQITDCFTVSATDYNNWISNGSIVFNLDPIDGSINPLNCTANRACVEIIISGCDDDLNLSTPHSTNGTFQAGSTIQSNAIVQSPANVIYQAGSSITLNASFEVQAGATFTAEIQDCNAQTVQNKEIPSILRWDEQNATNLKETATLTTFPNPFNQTTNIQFSLPESANIQMNLFNVNGQLVKSIIPKQHYEAGTYQIEWQKGEIPTGIYFLNLVGLEKPLVQKVIITK